MSGKLYSSARWTRGCDFNPKPRWSPWFDLRTFLPRAYFLKKSMQLLRGLWRSQKPVCILCILCVLFSQLRVEKKIKKKTIYTSPLKKVRKVCKVCMWPCGCIRSQWGAAYFFLEVCTSQKKYACWSCVWFPSNRQQRPEVWSADFFAGVHTF